MPVFPGPAAQLPPGVKDLPDLVDKVKTLEAKVEELEAKVKALEAAEAPDLDSAIGAYLNSRGLTTAVLTQISRQRRTSGIPMPGFSWGLGSSEPPNASSDGLGGSKGPTPSGDEDDLV